MRADNIEIAPLSSGELDSVSTLYHTIWHETHAPYQDARIAKSRDLKFFKSRLQRGKENTLLARIGVELAGFACWKGPALEALFVEPRCRSSGVGAKLLARAEDAMRKFGPSELLLNCVCANAAGRKFYEDNGWRVLKTAELRDDIYQDIVTPHWLMVK